jgi:probable rRNA maturation factor
MSSKSKVYFFFDNVRVNLKDRTKIKRAIELIFKKEKKKLVCLRYIFCNDSIILSINKQYLKHNYYTDIITFDLSKTKGRIEGEIYISVDRLKENAGILRHLF